MKRISISLYDEAYASLEKIMVQESMSSIAQCVRELLDLAIKIRKAATNSSVRNERDELVDAIHELKNLFKSDLSWTLETRLLVRFLVENHASIERENSREIMEKYKNSANQYINGLYEEKVD